MSWAGLASNGNRVGLFRHGAQRRPEGESVCPFPCAHIDLRRPAIPHPELILEN
jgi:hypothetical protein